MNSLGKYLLVLIGSLSVGAALFVASFIAMDFIWTHVVVRTPKDVGLGDGIMAVDGGSLLGGSLGLAGIVFMLHRFWPKRASR